jgi:hypothetical protein
MIPIKLKMKHIINGFGTCLSRLWALDASSGAVVIFLYVAAIVCMIFIDTSTVVILQVLQIPDQLL